MVNFDDPRNYRICQKKQYDIYCCMPPKDTLVINRLEQADTVAQLGGRTYYTADTILRMQRTNDGRLGMLKQLVASGKAYAVSDRTPFVLAGTIGELWCISADKLARTYRFVSNGMPVAINDGTLQQRMGNALYMNWNLIRSMASERYYACFVPVSQKGQIRTSWGAVLNINGHGVTHGKGDFVLCSGNPDGSPNMNDRWVVNGEIFRTTYNNQGWVKELSAGVTKERTITQLPNLCS